MDTSDAGDLNEISKSRGSQRDLKERIKAGEGETFTHSISRRMMCRKILTVCFLASACCDSKSFFFSSSFVPCCFFRCQKWYKFIRMLCGICLPGCIWSISHWSPRKKAEMNEFCRFLCKDNMIEGDSSSISLSLSEVLVAVPGVVYPVIKALHTRLAKVRKTRAASPEYKDSFRGESLHIVLCSRQSCANCGFVFFASSIKFSQLCPAL